MYKAEKFKEGVKNSLFFCYMVLTTAFVLAVCQEARDFYRVLVYILGFSFGKLVVIFIEKNN